MPGIVLVTGDVDVVLAAIWRYPSFAVPDVHPFLLVVDECHHHPNASVRPVDLYAALY